jgi:hypothetical protein
MITSVLVSMAEEWQDRHIVMPLAGSGFAAQGCRRSVGHEHRHLHVLGSVRSSGVVH